jgi:hypothetical protein
LGREDCELDGISNDATFDRSATAFENPDFVHISLHNSRWYMGLEPGESKYDELEKKIGSFPTISLPTITLEGDANGAPHADPGVYAKKYTGKYEHRNVMGGIGHDFAAGGTGGFCKGRHRRRQGFVEVPSWRLLR